jgi:hypothetical protein
LTYSTSEETESKIGIGKLKHGILLRKWHSAEKIVAKLIQTDVMLVQQKVGADVARAFGVTEMSCGMFCSAGDLLLVAIGAGRDRTVGSAQ